MVVAVAAARRVIGIGDVGAEPIAGGPGRSAVIGRIAVFAAAFPNSRQFSFRNQCSGVT
jgi:hypothetical protein